MHDKTTEGHSFTDVVQKIACSESVTADAWNRSWPRGYANPTFPDAWTHASSVVLFYAIPRDGDCVGDIDVEMPPGVDAAIYFDGRILWSWRNMEALLTTTRLPLGGGINMQGTRGHGIYLLLKDDSQRPPGECVADSPPRVTATFRCHEPWAVRLSLVERSPMRDLIITDW